MISLYDFELSGNCYKIRLILSLLGLSHMSIPVDFYPGREHQSEDFLRINPLGQLPVLRDGDVLIRDAQAILVYLAAQYDPTQRWYPLHDPVALGQISQWLAFADMITGTASAARLHDGLFYDTIDVEKARSGAHRLFRILDEHLWFAEASDQRWIVPGETPTIADIACFPYTVLAPEGGISLRPYPAMRRWQDRFKRIPSFITMSGVFAAT